MLPNKPENAWIGALLGTLFFVSTYGVAILNPTEIGWLLHGDPAQHYLGWEFFRREPWSLPLGHIGHFGAPVGTSIVFTDSIPLLAIPLKLFTPWLPETFQYLGGWMLLCYALTGSFAWRIFTRLGLHPIAAAGGSLLLVTLPALMLRAYGHESLMAQWLILAAIERYLAGWNGRAWLLWLLAAALVHPYLLLMLLALCAAAWLRAVGIDKTLTLRAGTLAILIGASLLLAVMTFAGHFIATPGQLAAEGYGHYSANLLTWLDPMDWRAFLQHYSRPTQDKGEWSTLLPSLGQATDGQYEGFAYLGAGLLLLGLTALLSRPRLPRVWWPLLGIATLLALAALSTKISLGSTQWIEIPLPERLLRLLSIFRASGRFIWPLTYLLALAAVVASVKNRSLPITVLILLLAVSLQIYDLSDKLREFRQHFGHPSAYQTPLSDPLWKQAGASSRHIVLYPANAPGEEWIPFAYLAALSGASINASYVARSDQIAQQAAAQALEQDIAAAKLQPDTLYILRDKELAHRLASRQTPPMEPQAADGHWLLLPYR